MNADLLIDAFRAGVSAARAVMTGAAKPTVRTPTSLKMTREALSYSQTGMGATEQGRRYLRIIQGLIDDIDRQRPTGPDGKHGDRHTRTCGCGPR